VPESRPPIELHGVSLTGLQTLIDERRLPPVEQWNPDRCGHSEMRIARDGIWYHQGSPINRPAMVRLFSRVLRREPDGSHVLVTPVEKLEDGFYSISGAAVDAKGKLYFVDKHQQRIYGWSQGEGLSIERDNPTDPVNLVFDKSGNLLVLSSLGAEGTLYSFKPGSPATELTVIAPTPARAHPEATARSNEPNARSVARLARGRAG